MKKLHKIKLQKNYGNLSLIFNDKSDYLKNLEKKRNDGLKIINEQKASLVIEDTFKINKFKRNYSCFSYNSGFDKWTIPLKIDVSQILKMPIKHKEIEDYSCKKINNNQICHISLNKYLEKQKNKFQIRHVNKLNNNNKRYKLLMNAGKDIIMKKNNGFKNRKNLNIQI